MTTKMNCETMLKLSVTIEVEPDKWSPAQETILRTVTLSGLTAFGLVTMVQDIANKVVSLAVDELAALAEVQPPIIEVKTDAS